MAIVKQNPNNNILRFLFIIGLPSLLLLLISCFSSLRKFLGNEPAETAEFPAPECDKTWIRTVLWLAVIAVVAVVAGNYYTYHKTSVLFDEFHEGETLGAAIDYLKGRVPFRDTIFVHGVFQDPLRSVLAFKIFGKSIASVRTLESLMQILSLFLFSASIFFLFRRNIYYSAVALAVLLIIMLVNPFHLSFIIITRDVCLWLFIIVSVLLVSHMRDDAEETSAGGEGRVLFFLFSFIPMLALVHSVERGFFLLAASLINGILIYLFHFHGRDRKALLCHGLGYVAGLLVLGFAIGWAYRDFFLYNVVIMPKYKGLLDAYLYPFERARYLLPVIFIAAILWFLTIRFVKLMRSSKMGVIQKLKAFYIRYFIEIVLAMVSVFYFRSPLGRADTIHVKYVSASIFIAGVYILMKHYLAPMLMRKGWTGAKALGVGASSMLVLFISLYTPDLNWKEFYDFPAGTPDEEIVSSDDLEVAAYLKTNLKDDEYFLTMTNEATWYYLVDKASPTRFQIVWLALPYFFQNEIVEDLNKKNVKLILYENRKIWMKIDGISNERRLPILVDYIRREYVPYKKIKNSEIWIRRSALEGKHRDGEFLMPGTVR
ncbi:MAG: hypothetical protein LBQ00_07020 [Syntrophobacterales bacterium]|jgi:hypothetical protein|nr:hypothetical protein [Syntrophobacterales bacterium]